MYTEFMQVCKEMGHMTEISREQASQSNRIFISHHQVLKVVDENSKLRVVFNGSIKTDTGLTLNEFLLPGPKLQNDIASILINWRSYKFVSTADMVRQIAIAPDDRIFQNIV